MARPSGYSIDTVERVCERIAEGDSLAAVCRQDWAPAVRTFLHWISEHEEAERAYVFALEAKAIWVEEQCQQIAMSATDRDSASAARVKLEHFRWIMSKQAPSKYGDRLDVSLEHKVSLAEVMDRRRKVLEANEKLGLPGVGE